MLKVHTRYYGMTHASHDADDHEDNWGCLGFRVSGSLGFRASGIFTCSFHCSSFFFWFNQFYIKDPRR